MMIAKRERPRAVVALPPPKVVSSNRMAAIFFHRLLGAPDVPLDENLRRRANPT
jgi:hypothetical protein